MALDHESYRKVSGVLLETFHDKPTQAARKGGDSVRHK